MFMPVTAILFPQLALASFYAHLHFSIVCAGPLHVRTLLNDQKYEMRPGLSPDPIIFQSTGNKSKDKW